MEIEMTIFDHILPVNALAVMRRIEEILKENKTNTTLALDGEALSKVQACILILWEIAKFQSWDVFKEWERVREELKPQLIAQKDLLRIVLPRLFGDDIAQPLLITLQLKE